MKNSILLACICACMMVSCAVIRPGEVGVKRKLGKLKTNTHSQGMVLLNPFTTTVIKVPTKTVNKEVKLNLPSKEGLNVAAEISILYHVEEQKAIDILTTVERNMKKFLF